MTKQTKERLEKAMREIFEEREDFDATIKRGFSFLASYSPNTKISKAWDAVYEIQNKLFEEWKKNKGL